MKEFNFKRNNKNITIKFGDEPLQDFRDWEVEEFKVNGNIITPDGVFNYRYNRAINKNVFCYSLNKKGSDEYKNLFKIHSDELVHIMLEKEIEEYYKDIIKPMLILKKEEYKNNEKIEKEKLFKKLYEEINDEEIIDMNYDTSYKFHISSNKENELLFDRIVCKLKASDNYFTEELEPYKTDFDWGDYTMTTYYKVPVKIIKNIYEKALNILKEKEDKEKLIEIKRQEKINSFIQKAKETGVKQEYSRWCEPCNDKNEECSMDLVIQYIDGNGNFSYEREHTY